MVRGKVILGSGVVGVQEPGTLLVWVAAGVS